jgi:hypothetical protein
VHQLCCLSTQRPHVVLQGDFNNHVRFLGHAIDSFHGAVLLTGMLTLERLKQVWHYDPFSGLFTRKLAIAQHRAGSIAVKNHNQGYIVIAIDGNKYLAHRLAVFYMTGEWPEKLIDHRNRNRADNRWCNLRPANKSQNAVNSKIRSDNTSGLRGVSWAPSRKKWESQLNVNGKTIHLGRFDCPVAAHLAYVIAAHSTFKDFTD